MQQRHFLTKVLGSFQMVFLRNSSKFWPTSDNPVMIDNSGNYDWIIPIEAEITLPLSKEICLFMFHEKSEISSNSLRTLTIDKVHVISDEIFDHIFGEIFKFYSNHIILPYRYENGNIMNKK
jgi:hypothetical protein